jgi:threonine aldolase
VIDLRSDTITKPTPAMREVMFKAEVGDAVLGDDPTVLALQERVAEILGKEAALYMPSGTMTNQVAVRTHTEAGDEIVLDASAHIYYYEGGAPAALSGVMCRLLPGKRGIFTADDVRSALRLSNVHFAPTKLICIENTHNRGGGSIWPVELIAEVADLAKENNLKMHMDGARLWNASVATGIPEAEYARFFDSVSVCFSKGLGAPVGSALAGSAEFIDRTRRFMKQFGGGMRQAGIIAAGALYALENHRDRLVEDHENAKILAEGLNHIPGIEIDVSTVETNIVLFRLMDGNAVEFFLKAHEAGVYVLPSGADTIRAVTSLQVNRDDIVKGVEIIRSVLSGNGRSR